MPFVIDASVAVCWLMPDERHPIADAARKRIAHDRSPQSPPYLLVIFHLTENGNP